MDILTLDFARLFENRVMRFPSKDFKDKLKQEFEPILDKRSIGLKDFMGGLDNLIIDDVLKEAKMFI